MIRMRIVGVLAPGAGICVQGILAHGEDPRMMLWRRGWVLRQLLSAYLEDAGVLLTGGFSGGIGKNNIQAHAEKHNTGLAKSSKYRLFTPMWWHNDTGETLP